VSAQEGDRLLWVGQCQEDSSVLLASSGGKALHLLTTNKELRPMGRTARGHRVCTSPLLQTPPPFPLPPHASHVIAPLTPATHSLSTHHTAHLHVMPFLDWPPPGQTFGSLVQESDDRLTMHILHGTSCQHAACLHAGIRNAMIMCVLAGHGTCKE